MRARLILVLAKVLFTFSPAILIGKYTGQPDTFVELKTSLTIRGPHDEAKFEKYVDSNIDASRIFYSLHLSQKIAQVLFPIILAWSTCRFNICGDIRNNLTKISGNSGGISNAVRSCDNDADL